MSAFTLIAVLLLAIGWDWLGVTRLAAYYIDFDYRYWPLSSSRKIGLAALVLAAAYGWAMTGSNAPLWTLIPFVILFGIWVATALKDVNLQRRSGNKTPPRYSDGEY